MKYYLDKLDREIEKLLKERPLCSDAQAMANALGAAKSWARNCLPEDEGEKSPIVKSVCRDLYFVYRKLCMGFCEAEEARWVLERSIQELVRYLCDDETDEMEEFKRKEFWPFYRQEEEK